MRIREAAEEAALANADLSREGVRKNPYLDLIPLPPFTSAGVSHRPNPARSPRAKETD